VSPPNISVPGRGVARHPIHSVTRESRRGEPCYGQVDSAPAPGEQWHRLDMACSVPNSHLPPTPTPARGRGVCLFTCIYSPAHSEGELRRTRLLVFAECPFGLSVTPSITADADWPLNPLARRPRTSYPLYRIRSRIPAPRSQRSERVHHASPRRMWILVHAMYWLHASSARRSFLRGMRSEGVELLPLRHSGIPIYR
jgi:hypothetical protein